MLILNLFKYLYLLCVCVFFNLVNEHLIMIDAITESPTSVIVVIITFFSCWSVIGLAGFHTFLAASNQTTNEDVSAYFIFI